MRFPQLRGQCVPTWLRPVETSIGSSNPSWYKYPDMSHIILKVNTHIDIEWANYLKTILACITLHHSTQLADVVWMLRQGLKSQNNQQPESKSNILSLCTHLPCKLLLMNCCISIWCILYNVCYCYNEQQSGVTGKSCGSIESIDQPNRIPLTKGLSMYRWEL